MALILRNISLPAVASVLTKNALSTARSSQTTPFDRSTLRELQKATVIQFCIPAIPFSCPNYLSKPPPWRQNPTLCYKPVIFRERTSHWMSVSFDKVSDKVRG